MSWTRRSGGPARPGITRGLTTENVVFPVYGRVSAFDTESVTVSATLWPRRRPLDRMIARGRVAPSWPSNGLTDSTVLSQLRSRFRLVLNSIAFLYHSHGRYRRTRVGRRRCPTPRCDGDNPLSRTPAHYWVTGWPDAGRPPGRILFPALPEEPRMSRRTSALRSRLCRSVGRDPVGARDERNGLGGPGAATATAVGGWVAACAATDGVPRQASERSRDSTDCDA
jgi:hypothetical protein